MSFEDTAIRDYERVCDDLEEALEALRDLMHASRAYLVSGRTSPDPAWHRAREIVGE